MSCESKARWHLVHTLCWQMAALEALKKLQNSKSKTHAWREQEWVKCVQVLWCFHAKTPAWEHFTPLLSLQTEGNKNKLIQPRYFTIITLLFSMFSDVCFYTWFVDIRLSENRSRVRRPPPSMLFNLQKYYSSKTCRETKLSEIWIKISHVECDCFFPVSALMNSLCTMLCCDR